MKPVTQPVVAGPHRRSVATLENFEDGSRDHSSWQRPGMHPRFHRSRPRSCADRTWVCLAMLGFAWIGMPPAFSCAQPASASGSRMESYLTQLGLEELEIEWLEAQLFSSQLESVSEQQRLARKLLQRYSRLLLDPASENTQLWLTRTQTLLASFPSLRTPSIELAIAQASYGLNEAAFRDWWKSGGRLADSQPVANQHRQLQIRLNKLYTDLTAEYDDQLTILRTSLVASETLTRRLDQLELELARTRYLQGWNSYYLGVLIPNLRAESLTESNLRFREFLQLDEAQVITAKDVSWVDVSSSWQSRALAGLAMCQQGLDHPQQSQACFDLLQSSANRTSTLDLIPIWKLNARVYMNDQRGLRSLVDSVGQEPGISELGRSRFWSECWYSGQALSQRSPDASQLLKVAAIRGLAREFRTRAIRSLLESERLDLAQNSFLKSWVEGLLELEAWRALPAGERDRKRLEPTLAKLKTALSQSPDDTPAEDLTACRYVLAQVRREHRDLPAASRELLAVGAAFEKQGRASLAAEAQWSALAVLVELSQTRSEYLVPAQQAVESILLRYPGTPMAKRAELIQIQLINRRLPVEEAIERLQSIPQNDANASAAACEVARLRFEQWEQSESAEQRLTRLSSLQSAVARLTELSPQSKLATRAQLWELQALIRSEQISEAQLLVSDLEARLEEADSSDPRWAEWRFNRCLLACHEEQRDAVQFELDWLQQHAPKSPATRQALLQVAGFLEPRLEQLESWPADEVEFAVGVFRSLTGLLGTHDSELLASPNARVAQQRLAELLQHQSELEAAHEIWSQLHRLFPRRRDYLLQLARSEQQREKYEPALTLWKLLVAGSEAGSDTWLEAKCGMIESLFRNQETEQARRLAIQTLRLSPTASESWKTRLNDWVERLSNPPVPRTPRP